MLPFAVCRRVLCLTERRVRHPSPPSPSLSPLPFPPNPSPLTHSLVQSLMIFLNIYLIFFYTSSLAFFFLKSCSVCNICQDLVFIYAVVLFNNLFIYTQYYGAFSFNLFFFPPVYCMNSGTDSAFNYTCINLS